MSFHPHTPQSPSNSSPGISEPTSHMANSLASSTSTLPTPAHSISGSAPQPPFDCSHEMSVNDDSPNKRKLTQDDCDDRADKKVHVDDGKLSIEDLHLDVGTKYLFCKSPPAVTYPRSTEDFFKMFDLTGLAAEVAREKPNGEKNPLRKTYKGHIKRLGVIGNFDVVRKETTDPTGFMALVSVPELEWNVHEVKGKELSRGFSDMALGSLNKAMTMTKGAIPKNVWDGSVLGDLAPLNDSRHQSAVKGTAPGTPGLSRPKQAGGESSKASVQVGTNSGAQTPNPDPLRPKRNVKKRTYGDSSYEGYGEGFPDDDAAGLDAGYSTGEGDDRGSQKRRKKNSSSGQNFTNVMRQPNYGPGMVGA